MALLFAYVSGDEFDIREFHAIVVESGTLPLTVLGAVL